MRSEDRKEEGAMGRQVGRGLELLAVWRIVLMLSSRGRGKSTPARACQVRVKGKNGGIDG